MAQFQIQWGQEPYEDETHLTRRTVALCLSTVAQLTVLWFRITSSAPDPSISLGIITA